MAFLLFLRPAMLCLWLVRIVLCLYPAVSEHGETRTTGVVAVLVRPRRCLQIGLVTTRHGVLDLDPQKRTVQMQV
jgi:hypothetical protein